jgi:hypothetical protein
MDSQHQEEMLEKLVLVLAEINQKLRESEQGSQICFEDFVLKILEVSEVAAKARSC